MAYVDVTKLSLQHLEIDSDGISWIIQSRTKTGTNSTIPLIARAQTLINKYKADQNKMQTIFPVMSNQNLNKYLKEIAISLTLNKNLTMHVARHTFATTVTLEQGVDLTTVSRMLGHRDIKTTQIYAKITKCKIRSDMNHLLTRDQ